MIKKQPIKNEKIQQHGTAGSAHFWRENGAWNIRLTVPEWIAKDMQELGAETVVFVSRPVEGQDSPFTNRNTGLLLSENYTSLVLEQSPNPEEIGEMLLEEELVNEQTNELLQREIKAKLIDRHLKACTSYDHLVEAAHAIYYTHNVYFSPEELDKLWKGVIQPDIENRGEYSFSFDGKQVEGVVGQYTGFGSWTVRVTNLHSSFIFYGSTATRTNSLVVSDMELEQTIWLLASAFAVGRTWEAFIDPSRPRNFAKVKRK